MKKRFFVLLFLTLILFPILGRSMHNEEERDYATETGKPATIKVLIKDQEEGVLIEAKGAYRVYNPKNGKLLSRGFRGKRYFLYPHQDGIKWGEGFPGIYQIRIVPADQKTTLLVDGIEYRGAIDCYHIDNKISIINEVDIESYIKSILTSTLSTEFHPQVLDAIAIVARTNAYFISLNNRDTFWHTKAKQVGYDGNSTSFLNTNVDRAVDATRYLVMTYEHLPFPAAWTENSAGKTASYQTLFRKKTPCPDGIIAAFAEETRLASKWLSAIPKAKIAAIAKMNRVTGIESFIDEFSGKTYAIRVKDGTHFKDLDFVTLREQLGLDTLQSSDFKIALKDDQVLFEGYGKGLGVGLCLYSACCLAQKGETAPQILGTFFPLTRIVYMRNFPDSLNSADTQ